VVEQATKRCQHNVKPWLGVVFHIHLVRPHIGLSYKREYQPIIVTNNSRTSTPSTRQPQSTDIPLDQRKKCSTGRGISTLANSSYRPVKLFSNGKDGRSLRAVGCPGGAVHRTHQRRYMSQPQTTANISGHNLPPRRLTNEPELSNS